MAHQYKFASADEQLKLRVWVKGRVGDSYNGNFYRRDVFGSWIQYSAHGETLSHFGWEIAHIKPIEDGGTDDLSNLQPASVAEQPQDFDNLINRQCSG